MIDMLYNPVGRVSRIGYWYGYFLPFWVLTLITGLLAAFVPIAIWAFIIFQLFFIWPHLNILIKRLHDIGTTGWWVFLFCFPIGGLGYWIMSMQPALLVSGFFLNIMITYFGTLFFSVLLIAPFAMFKSGQHKDNHHGADPRQNGDNGWAV